MSALDRIFGTCESCLVRPATRFVRLGEGGLFCVCETCAPPAPARVIIPRSPARRRRATRIVVLAGFAVSAILMVTSLVLIGRWALRLLGVL